MVNARSPSTPTVQVSISVMNQSSEAVRWAALAALALTTTAIQAGILNVYSDEASFRSALSGIVFEGLFAGLPADTGYVSLVGGGGTPPLTYTMSSPGDGVYVFPAVAGFAQSVGQNAIGFPVLINGFSQFEVFVCQTFCIVSPQLDSNAGVGRCDFWMVILKKQNLLDQLLLDFPSTSPAIWY